MLRRAPNPGRRLPGALAPRPRPVEAGRSLLLSEFHLSLARGAREQGGVGIGEGLEHVEPGVLLRCSVVRHSLFFPLALPLVHRRQLLVLTGGGLPRRRRERRWSSPPRARSCASTPAFGAPRCAGWGGKICRQPRSRISKFEPTVCGAGAGLRQLYRDRQLHTVTVTHNRRRHFKLSGARAPVANCQLPSPN